METIVISTILVNICIGCFACVGLTTAISMIQSIINDHKREKREQYRHQHSDSNTAPHTERADLFCVVLPSFAQGAGDH